MTRTCNSGNAGCTGTTNDEFDPQGYFYIVRVGAAAVGTPGDAADLRPRVGRERRHLRRSAPTGTMKNAMNPLHDTDGLTRYLTDARSNGSPNNFCTGDVNNGSGTHRRSRRRTTCATRPTPTTPRSPRRSPAARSSTQPYCVRGHHARNATGTLHPAISNTTLDTQRQRAPTTTTLAKVYHQWVTLCTFTPTKAGDYYLQIRTNVALGGTADGQGGYQNNPKVYSPDRRRHLRRPATATTGSRSGSTGAQRGAVSIAGFQAMSIYANYTGANTTFNLVRVIPAAATKTLNIGFYDVGDATQRPAPSGAAAARLQPRRRRSTSCTGAGVVNGTMPSCQLTNVSSGYGLERQVREHQDPDPEHLHLQLRPRRVAAGGGCVVSFPGGVTDTTTWTREHRRRPDPADQVAALRPSAGRCPGG